MEDKVGADHCYKRCRFIVCVLSAKDKELCWGFIVSLKGHRIKKAPSPWLVMMERVGNIQEIGCWKDCGNDSENNQEA